MKKVLLLAILAAQIPAASAFMVPFAFWRPNCAACANGYSVGYQLTFNVHPSAALTSFPNLVSGTYSNLADLAHGGKVQNTVTLHGQTVPADLIFTSDLGGSSLLSWEIESWDNTTGAIRAWVSFNRSSTSDDVIYLWAGKSTVTTYQSTPSATWDSNFAGVWHFPNGTALALEDSTANANNGTNSGFTAAQGKIGGGASNTSASGAISVGSGASLNILAQPLTISAWVYLNSFGGSSKGHIFDEIGSTSPNYGFFVDNANVTNGLQFYVSPSGAYSNANVITTGTWYHVAVTFTANLVSFFVNGAAAGSSSFSNSLASGGTGAEIGNYTSGTRDFDGILDEIRVSTTARSTAWIAHEYLQQSQSSAWYTITSL